MSSESTIAGRWEYGQALAAEELLVVEAERTSFNLRRGRLVIAPLLVVMIILHGVFAWAVVPVDPAARLWRDNSIVLSNLLIACFALTLATFRFRPALAARAVDALIPCAALWGALSSANIQRTRPAVDFFLVANLSMVLVFRPRLRSLIATQMLATAVLCAGIIGLQSNRVVARTELVVVLIVSFTVLIVGRSNLALLAREVMARLVIDRQRAQLEAQSVELGALNRSLEDRVQAQVGLIVERSKELAQLNAELRERVDQGARDLTALLRRVSGGGAPDGLAIGSVLNDRFALESVLGASGMSVVYRACDRLTNEPVAVKVISPKSAHELGAMRRFLREARASVRVEHPAIVAARHIDLADGRLFAVFPFVEGTSLDRVLKRQGPLHLLRAVRTGRLIAGALAATHAAGVVHRDIKPGNVMITPDESAIRLLDFGISKLQEPESPDHSDTGEGVILGTPAYMAPEQVADARQAPDRADIYALGVVLFEMIVGRPPFTGSDPRAILVAKVLHAPPALASVAPHVPEALSVLVQRCTAKAPSDRPAASAVCDELLAIEKALPDDGQGRIHAARESMGALLAATINEDDRSNGGSE